MDWLFSVGGSICDVRTAGVLIRDGKILLQREASGNEYALPGGHVQIGETLEEALIREYSEECGAHISCVKMLWSEECFWEWNGKAAHQYAFYYLVELCGDANALDFDHAFPQKDHSGVLLEWIAIDQLHGITVYPSFLKEEIDHLDAGIRHFVTRA